MVRGLVPETRGINGGYSHLHDGPMSQYCLLATLKPSTGSLRRIITAKPRKHLLGELQQWCHGGDTPLRLSAYGSTGIVKSHGISQGNTVVRHFLQHVTNYVVQMEPSNIPQANWNQ